MNTEHNPEDYVLVHKTKAKLSRARKMVIGVMAVGAVSALAGAGTFASFSASTTNDGVFRTGRLELSNKANTGTACLSSDEGPGNTATADANLDENNTTCDALFSVDLRPGVISTATVVLENLSTYQNGKLYLFGTDENADGDNLCESTVNDATFRGGIKGTGNICDAVEVRVQEYNGTGGTAAPVFTTALGTCQFPTSIVTACDDTTNSWSSTNDNTALLSMFPASFDDTINDDVVGRANKMDLGAFNNTGAATDYRYFKVFVKMRSQAFSSTGYGPDNVYQNLKPDLSFKWLLQDQ